MRIGSLEFRQLGGDRPPEIVKWASQPASKEYCYTLMWFERDSEGYYAKFVGSRPFEAAEDGDLHVLWALMRYADKTLAAYVQLEDYIPESME